MKNLILTLFFSLTAILSFGQDLNALTDEIATSIELDEAQTKALKTQMEKYTISLQLIFDKYEEAEPDPQAMLTDIKHAREDYYKALKNDIGKEKFKAYEAYTDQVKLEVLSEAAGLRLLDLQDPLKMTDDQVTKMKPVMGKAMKGIMETLMQYIDKPMNVRTKLKVANSLKSIKKTMDRETAEILTQEQIKKWEEMKEAAKAEAEKQ
ncbi:MAG: hypothetical protein N4A46_00675 [Schleiferiaceae bacterium]|nr:hypothetical protein [Schleiferiaceae bacterium]